MTPSVVIRAMLPVSLRLGAVEVKPLSLGHWLFLTAIKSPLVVESGEEPDMMDLFRAVYALAHPLDVCAARWQAGGEAYDATVIEFSKQVQAYGLDDLKGRLVRHIAAAFDTAAKLEAPDMPHDTVEGADRPSDGLGWELRLLNGITTLKGWSDEYVLNLPRAKLFVYWAADSIANGAKWGQPSYEELDAMDDTVAAVKSLRG